MKLLADENTHGDVVIWMRSAGHDVVYVAESAAGLTDDQVLALANAEERVLVTDDKDFGEIVFRRRLTTHGIVLLRLTAPVVQDRIDRLAAVWPAIERHMPGRFIVVGDTKVRIRPLVMP